jgi:hypothetical protein
MPDSAEKSNASLSHEEPIVEDEDGVASLSNAEEKISGRREASIEADSAWDESVTKREKEEEEGKEADDEDENEDEEEASALPTKGEMEEMDDDEDPVTEKEHAGENSW